MPRTRRIPHNKLSLKLGKAALLSLVLASMSACANEGLTETKTSLPENATACPETRPQMCAAIYAPACGYKKDGSTKTYASSCNACGDAMVIATVEGACEGDETY